MTGNPVDAIILTGGKGTRLQSILDDRPKPMALIAGRPFVEWLLLMLRHQGIQRAVMCTGHLSEAVESYFGNGQDIGMELVYAYDPLPLGTGGAVRNALVKTNSKRFLVLNGDSYCRFDLSNFLKTHLAHNARVSLNLVQVKDCSRYGSVKINKDGMVLAFLEKSPGKIPGLVNAGVYLLERDVVEGIPEGKMVSLEKEILPGLIGNGLYAVVCKGIFIDIGTPESLNKAKKILKDEFKHLSQ